MRKPSDLSKTILLTHAGCMDGSGVAIMFCRAGGKRENIRYVAAGMLERHLKDNFASYGSQFVIMADIGLNLPRYADDLEKRGDLVLIDHHKTSLHLTGRDWCDVRQDCCGTELFRQYLGLEDESSKALARLIQDHDLWLQQDPNSTELAAFTVFVGQDVFVDRFMNRDVREGVFTPLEAEMMAIMTRRRDQFIEATLKKVYIRDIHWGDGKVAKVGYLVSSEMNVSLMLDRLCTIHPELDIACQINFDKGSVSLRSRNGYDVSEFAKQFGGGGHAAASGHRLNESFVKDIVENLHA